MIIEVTRTKFLPDRTLGKLVVYSTNGTARLFECCTLEHPVRGDGDALTVKRWKVAGVTAIPYGTYTCKAEMHAEKGHVIRVHDVFGFDGILIHVGNTPKDSRGCILVGTAFLDDNLYRSKQAMEGLYETVGYGDNILIVK